MITFWSAGACRDVPNLRRMTAAYDAAARRHPELTVNVNQLLNSARQFLKVPVYGTVEQRAELVMDRAVALQEAFARIGVSFSIVQAGDALLCRSSEELVQQVGRIEELLHGMGMLWSDMFDGTVPCASKWLLTLSETLSANAAALQTVFSPKQVRLIV